MNSSITIAGRGASRRNVLRLLLGAGAGTVAASTAGCGLFGDSAGGTNSITVQTTNFPVLDPHIVTYGMWTAAQGLLEGLVVQNNDGTDVEPGVAKDWKVSDDGLEYVFKLRDDAVWSNGDPVTAEDFEWSYKRLLTPAGSSSGDTLGANSYQVSMRIKGAEEHAAGTLEDWSKVGVSATGKRELTITLDRPNAGFMLDMTHPSMLPMHPATVKKYPEDWQKPEHWVGNGPFVLSAWKKNSEMTLKRHDDYWDAADVHLDTVVIRLIEGDMKTDGFDNGEVDITNLNSEDAVKFKGDDAFAKTEPNSVGYLALLRSKNPALEDVRVRKALALGLDREKITKNIIGVEPGTCLVPGDAEDWDDSLAVPYDIKEAKRLLSDAGYPDGKGLPKITILSGSSGSSTPTLDAIVDLWKNDLGIEVASDVVEAGAYVEKRFEVQPSDYVGFYIGSYSGAITWPYYAGALWDPKFTAEFSLPADVWSEYQKIQNDKDMDPGDKNDKLAELRDRHASDEAKEYAELVEEANATDDLDEQIALFKDATKARQNTYLFIPISWGSNLFAVRPSLEGVHLRPTRDSYYFKGIKVTE